MSLVLSDGQRLALAQLHDLAAVPGGAINLAVEPSLSESWLRAEISLDCAGTPSAAGGLRLHKRERFVLLISTDFPFEPPIIFVSHRRWAGTPHVQWGVQLCLYAAPSIEWVPADGMFGFVERLVTWLTAAALDDLDPDDQPLHPPVAYVSGDNGVMVVRADLGALGPTAHDPGRQRYGTTTMFGEADPGADAAYRLVVGITQACSENRLDVIEWVSRAEWLRRFAAGDLPSAIDGQLVSGALAVLTNREMSFEYPKQAVVLVAALETLGVPRDQLFTAIGEVAAVNYELARQQARDGSMLPPQLHLLVGTPSRRLADGTLRQHLACWRFDEIGRSVAENIVFAQSNHPALAHLGHLAQHLLPSWIANTDTSWVRVMEARPEVTIRRDTGSSAEWIRGRRVLILGCGALGGPTAEFCVRGGASEVSVVDNDVVTPGILVRQPYIDSDIGIHKAPALAARLNRVRPDQPVRAIVGSAQTAALADGAPPPDVDLVIDATANAAVASLIELRRAHFRALWPPVMSLMIGHDARRGVVTIAKQGATGGGRHVLRRLALGARGQDATTLEDVAADFFPTEARPETFQPEPGCSSPTFTGSAADLSALAGHLFDAGLRSLTGTGPDETDQPMVAAIARLDQTTEMTAQPGTIWFGWPNDAICRDSETGYEIRISQPALARMRAEVRRGARLRGPKIETGGVLLGQVDDACRCIWVDDVSGPPPDSLLSAVYFDHGIEGVEELVAYHRDRSGRLTTFLGMWHSHPRSEAAPSLTDKTGMRTLVTPLAKSPSRALIVIVGGNTNTWSNWVNDGQAPDIFAQLATRTAGNAASEVPPVPARNQTDAWPGGWGSRPRPHHPAKRRVRFWPPRIRRDLRLQ